MSLWICLALAIFSTAIQAFGQTQAPSVQAGVTFQWADTQTVNNDPATISGITINGTVYNNFTAPSEYRLTRLGPDGHNENNIIENGVNVNTNLPDVQEVSFFVAILAGGATFFYTALKIYEWFCKHRKNFNDGN